MSEREEKQVEEEEVETHFAGAKGKDSLKPVAFREAEFTLSSPATSRDR